MYQDETFPLPRQLVGDGDRVAVMIDGEAVVRTFGDWLSDEVTILGKVVSVIHRT